MNIASGWLSATAGFAKELLLLLLINLVISTLLFLLSETDDFLALFIYANCVGFSCVCLAQLLTLLASQQLKVWQAHLLTLAPGLLLGLTLAGALGYPEALDYMVSQPLQSWRNWALCLLLVLIGAAFTLSRYQAQVYRAALERERRQLAEYRQADIQAQLRLLQAQIEPHFLFNTLANVDCLISRDPQQAQQMLSHLNHYLRASLLRTRAPVTTLAQEFELLAQLLAIAKIRLGQRLSYSLNLPAELAESVLPPLLLQPLVENALSHGIEPLLGHGTVQVQATQHAQGLLLRVTDNGVGLTGQTPKAPGIGLHNIRQRLFCLYGDKAQLALFQADGGGCVAQIQLPLTALAKTTPLRNDHANSAAG